MSFSKLPIGACGGLMGLGWLSVCCRDLTQGRVGAFGLFVRLLALICLV